jgi:hypothetical protein
MVPPIRFPAWVTVIVPSVIHITAKHTMHPLITDCCDFVSSTLPAKTIIEAIAKSSEAMRCRIVTATSNASP